MHIMVDNANSTIDTINTRRRPYLSLIGPKKTCPTASPSILIDKPICTNDGVEWKTSANDGRVGKYISVTKGPNADNAPNNMIKNMKYLRPNLVIVKS